MRLGRGPGMASAALPPRHDGPNVLRHGEPEKKRARINPTDLLRMAFVAPCGAPCHDGADSIRLEPVLTLRRAGEGTSCGRLLLLRRRRLRREAADRVVDLVEQTADAHGIVAEVVRPEAGGGAHVDLRAARCRTDADHDVVAQSHDRRACDRLDGAIPACAAWRMRVNDLPLAADDEAEHDAVGLLWGDVLFQRYEIGIGGL